MSRAHVRLPFTDSEDQNLIKYIAKHKPEPQGRLGNNLYKALEENPGNQWPWSRNHSWMSWRERYKKNQELFDYKIKRYQKQLWKKKQEEPEDPGPESESTSNTEQSIEKQPQVAHTSKAKSTAIPDKQIPAADAPAPEPRARKAVERHEKEGKTKIVSSKPASDLRPQKVAEEREKEAKTVASEPAPGPTPQHAVEKSRKEAKIVSPKPSSDPRPQKEMEKRGKGPEAKTTASKPAQELRPPKAAEKHEEAETSAIEHGNDIVRDDSVQPLSEDEMRDLFGSFVEESEEEEQKQPAISNLPQPDETENADIEMLECIPVPEIYPNLKDAPTPGLGASEPRVPGAFVIQPQVLSQEPTPPKSGAETRPTEKTTLKPARPPPKQRKRPTVEDPFETPSDTPSNPPRPAAQKVTPTRKPPVLDEGHFRTTFKRSRPTAADDEDEDRPWPPKRSKRERDARVKQSTMPGPLVRPRQEPQVNAVASSSKTKLPPSIAANIPSAVIPRTHTEPLLGHDVSGRSSVMERRTLGVIPGPSTNTEKTVPNPREIRTVAQKASINNEITSKALFRTGSHSLPTRPSSGTDPFTAKHVSEKAAGKARANDSYVIENKPPRHIDLHRETLSKRRRTNNSHSSRRSSVLSSRTSLSSSPKKVPPKSNSLRQSISELDLPDDEVKQFALAAAQDIAGIMERMAKEYGFSTEIAMSTYMNTRSIESTRFILDQLRQEMAEKERALYARLPNLKYHSDGEHDTENEVPHGLVLRKSTGKSSGKSSNRSSPRKSKRPSLNVKPLIMDDDAVSDYSPPNSSRAGQFARLVKQGRKEEAIEREKRRASGMFVPQTQHGGNNRSLLPREISATPTPHPRDEPMDVDNDQETVDDDDDDMYVRTDDEQTREAHDIFEQEHEADDEFEHTQEQEKDDLDSPSFTGPQKLEQLVQEAQDRNPQLALEYQMLALNVNADNADTMRKFEARNDPDFLRLMSLKLVGDLLGPVGASQE